jgi:hypothetical protein
MLNMWKYDHLCENLIFIGYLCEICLMYGNMAICVKIWLLLNICVKYAQCVIIWPFDILVLFLKCAVSEALCLVFNGHYTGSANCLVSDKEKERHALTMRISHLRQRETHIMGMHLFLLNCAKKSINRIFSMR